MSKGVKRVSLGVLLPIEAAGNIPKFEARFSVVPSALPEDVSAMDGWSFGTITFEWNGGTAAFSEAAVATVAAEPEVCPSWRCAVSRASKRRSTLSFHLETASQSKTSSYPVSRIESLRSIFFQEHLQTLVHSTRQASSPAARARSAATCDITLDLADESA